MSPSPTLRTWPNVAPGQKIATWTETPTNVDLFVLGVAYWTTHRIHYDEKWARQEGYPGVVITGVLMYGWIERTLITWAGSPDRIHRFRFRHIGLACVGDTLQISLTANEVHPGSDHGEVHVGISITKEPDGQRILEGTAILRLPTAIAEEPSPNNKHAAG